MMPPTTQPPRIFTREYYERMRALEAGSWWNAAMRNAAERMFAHAELPNDGVLIDIGCGSGQTLAWWLERHIGWRGVGLDVAPEGVQAASAVGLNVMEASALALPMPDTCADLLITLDVLQHLPLNGGDVVAMREMHRVLRPGGYLLIRTNAQSLPHAPDDPEFQFRKYEPAQLRAKLVSVGFDVVRLGRINSLLGLAEIPRELRAQREQGRDGYHGILAGGPAAPRAGNRLKRMWLGIEARAGVAGWELPLGRTILALCRVPPSRSP